jgi:hypothetical protein
VLRLEQREVKRADEQKKKFAVPVLDLMVSPAQLLSGGDPLDAGTLSIEPPAVNGNLTPVPDSVPERPTPPIAEQAHAEKPKRKPRKNAAQKLPETGLEPRTAQQAAEQTPPQPADNKPDDADAPDRGKLNRHMHALFNEAQISDREDRLTITRYLTRRFDINSSSDLADEELSGVIATLTDWKHKAELQDKTNDLLNQAAVDKWQDTNQ